MRINKLFLLIYFLGLFFYKGFGQTYQKVAIPDKTTWLVAQEQLFGRFIDTLYAKNQIDDQIEIWFGCSDLDEQILMGMLRESEDYSKLWFTPNGTSKNEELLVFDLTLEKGDTFYLGSTLTTVDTVFYRDNLKYIEFDISTIWDENLRFIEGVGPNISVAWMVHPGIQEPYVVCKYDDALFYVTENPIFIDCSINTTNSEEMDNYYEIKIYPNPTTGLIKFQNHSYSVKEILVYDTTGRQFFIENKIDEMDLSHLPDGFYLIKIIWINGITETHKILKNSF
ncbi:MAG: T9SS type A sorting domain-containing protein [Bacteroidales bacterium]|nr:T9SS type A sorting domain-containing protein [Bacteroidales bacterium]